MEPKKYLFPSANQMAGVAPETVQPEIVPEQVAAPDNSPLPDGSTQQFVQNSAFPEQQQRVADDPALMDTPANTATGVPAATPAGSQSLTTDELVKGMYSLTPPAPTLDQAKLDRIQKMGRLNMLGRGVGVLGNILSSAVGARVNKANPDAVTPRLLAEYQNTLDKYKDQKDIHEIRNYAQRREDAKFGISYAQQKERQKLAEENLKLTRDMANAKRDEDHTKWKKTYAQNQGKIDDMDKRAQERNKISAAKTGAKGKALKEHIVNTAKQSYKMKDEEYSYLRGAALQNTPEIQKRYPSWFIKVPELNEGGEPTGQYITKLDPRVKDDELVRVQKEMEEEQASKPPPAQPVYTTPLRAGVKPTQQQLNQKLGQSTVPAPEAIPAHANQPAGTVTAPSKEEMAKNAQQVAPPATLDYYKNKYKSKRSTKTP